MTLDLSRVPSAWLLTSLRAESADLDKARQLVTEKTANVAAIVEELQRRAEQTLQTTTKGTENA